MKIFYIVLIAALFGLSGCELPEKSAMENQSPLTLRYQTSAEAAYTDIRVEAGQVIYTFFTDTDNRCAQWFKSTPCWRPDDLKTVERTLTDDELDGLYSLLEQPAVVALDNGDFGESNLRKRAYTETLTIVYKNIERKLHYRSTPDAEPKPSAFAAVEKLLREYVSSFSGGGAGDGKIR